MTSKRDVISRQSIILSADDTRITNLEYSAGDKFLLRHLDESFSEEQRRLLEGERIIVEIQGFALTHEGKIVYDVKIIDPQEEKFDFHWLLNDDDIEASFFYLGDSFQSARFVFIGD